VAEFSAREKLGETMSGETKMTNGGTVSGPGVSRRSLAGAAAFAGAALGAAATQAATKPAPSEPTLWSAEYWANKGAVRLNVFRKRLGAPKAGEPPKPVLLLVHGSSLSSRTTYDLSVPGAGEYSMMNVFARAGYDCWTADHEGYGRSTVTTGNSDIKSGVEDLKAVTDLIAKETGQSRVHMMGESSGALRVGAFANLYPERAGRLTLVAFTWTGVDSPTLADRRNGLDSYRKNNRRKRDLKMIESIYTRDKPGLSDPRVPAAVAAMELPLGDSVPTGTYLDMSANLPVVDPGKLLSPVLMVRGQYDGIASEADCLDFFRRLPNFDRQFVMLADSAHAIGSGYTRAQLWRAIQDFLSMPPSDAPRT
jgi:pimeloyl-ACP methyl ester carboxylesterase